MPIIKVNHVTKEYKLGLKHMALGDIAAEADTVSNAFVGAALAAKTRNWCLTPLTVEELVLTPLTTLPPLMERLTAIRNALANGSDRGIES